MRKRTSLILTVGVTVAATLLVAGCNSTPKSNANAAEVRSATVAVVRRGDISHTLSLAGQFQPYQVVDVHPKVSGFMVKINVDIGDMVRQGETLAVLEVPELKAQLEGTGFEMQQSQGRDCSRAARDHSAPKPSILRCTRTITGCWTPQRRSRA